MNILIFSSAVGLYRAKYRVNAVVGIFKLPARILKTATWTSKSITVINVTMQPESNLFLFIYFTTDSQIGGRPRRSDLLIPVDSDQDKIEPIYASECIALPLSDFH